MIDVEHRRFQILLANIHQSESVRIEQVDSLSPGIEEQVEARRFQQPRTTHSISTAPYSPLSNSAAPFSAIAITTALVLPEITDGIIEASTTYKLSTPRTLSCSSTTDAGSTPI